MRSCERQRRDSEENLYRLIAPGKAGPFAALRGSLKQARAGRT
jgi:hypothetical protein